MLKYSSILEEATQNHISVCSTKFYFDLIE